MSHLMNITLILTKAKSRNHRSCIKKNNNILITTPIIPIPNNPIPASTDEEFERIIEDLEVPWNIRSNYSHCWPFKITSFINEESRWDWSSKSLERAYCNGLINVKKETTINSFSINLSHIFLIPETKPQYVRSKQIAFPNMSELSCYTFLVSKDLSKQSFRSTILPMSLWRLS